jgi:hypothetical protein
MGPRGSGLAAGVGLTAKRAPRQFTGAETVKKKIAGAETEVDTGAESVFFFCRKKFPCIIQCCYLSNAGGSCRRGGAHPIPWLRRGGRRGGAHPIPRLRRGAVSAQSQLSTCEDARPSGDALTCSWHGRFRGSINLLASHTPVPIRFIGQGRDSKPSESGVKPQGKKSWGTEPEVTAIWRGALVMRFLLQFLRPG